MFTAALFKIAKKEKQPKCPSMNKYMNKMWYIQTVEYYFTIKRDKIPTYATSTKEPQQYHTKWKKPDTDTRVPFYMKCQNKTKIG